MTKNNSKNTKEKPKIANKVAFNSMFSSVAKVSWTVISIVSLGIINRLLGAEGVGKYNTILTFFFLFTAIGDLGLNAITAREISKTKTKKEESHIISVVLGIRLIISAILMLVSVALYFILNYGEDIRKGIILVSFGIFFAITYQSLTGVFQKRLIAYKVSAAEFIGRLTTLFWVIACWKFNLGLLFVLGGMLISWTTIFTIVLIMTRKIVKFNIKFDYKKSKELLLYSLPIGISAIVTFLYFRGDIFVLSKLKDMTAVGIHSAAYKIVENLAYFPAMFMGLIMPLLSKYIGRNKKKFRKIANRSFDALAILAFGILFGIMSLSEEIIAIIAGKEFGASILPLTILSFAIFGIFFGQYFNMVLIASNQQKKTIFVFLTAAIFNLTSNYFFIPKYSYLATATISSITELLVPTICAVLLYKTTKFLPGFKAFFKSFAAGLGMFLILIILNKFIPLSENKFLFLFFTGFKILIGILTYFTIIFALKTINKEDFKNLLPGKLKSLI